MGVRDGGIEERALRSNLVEVERPPEKGECEQSQGAVPSSTGACPRQPFRRPGESVEQIS